MLETWKRATEKVKVISDLLTDSKGFDCLSHELPTAKLNVFGFSLPALRLIIIYKIKNREQK